MGKKWQHPPSEILKCVEFLNILLFRQPQLVYFGSHDEGQGCSDLSDLTRFLPGKVPPKKGKLLILAYKEAEKYY